MFFTFYLTWFIHFICRWIDFLAWATCNTNAVLELSRVLMIKAGMLTRWSGGFEGFTLVQVTLMVGSSCFPWQGMSRLRPVSSLYCLSGVMLNDGGSCFMSNKAASGRLQRFQQWILRLDYRSFGQDYLNNKRISPTINSLIVEPLQWVWVDLH